MLWISQSDGKDNEYLYFIGSCPSQIQCHGPRIIRRGRQLGELLGILVIRLWNPTSPQFGTISSSPKSRAQMMRKDSIDRHTVDLYYDSLGKVPTS